MIQNFCATCRVCAGTAHAKEHNCCTGETKYRPTRPLETRDRSGTTVTCLVQIERPSSRPSGIVIPPGSARGFICTPDGWRGSHEFVCSSNVHQEPSFESGREGLYLREDCTCLHVRPRRLSILECHFNKTTHHLQSQGTARLYLNT